MTDKAFPRAQFDRKLTFIVNKPITLNGETVACGTVFDKSLVTERKLRQLFDQRYLRFAEAAEHAPPLPPEQPAAENRARVRLTPRALSRPRPRFRVPLQE